MVQKAGFDLDLVRHLHRALVEIAQVTPPVGFNLFVLQTMTGRDINYVARASIPFFLLMVHLVALIYAFPRIVTVLPDHRDGLTDLRRASEAAAMRLRLPRADHPPGRSLSALMLSAVPCSSAPAG